MVPVSLSGTGIMSAGGHGDGWSSAADMDCFLDRHFSNSMYLVGLLWQHIDLDTIPPIPLLHDPPQLGSESIDVIRFTKHLTSLQSLDQSL